MNNSLPMPVRLNNPCNLSRNWGPFKQSGYYMGRPLYADLFEGTRAACYAIHQVYTVMGFHTLADVLPRVYEDSHIDMLPVHRDFRQRLGIGEREALERDLKLHQAWRVIDFLRCWIARENGRCPPTFADGGEWIGPGLIVDALAATNHWTLR